MSASGAEERTIGHAQPAAISAPPDRDEPAGDFKTVRDSVFDVMRRFGMTTIFGNPGSTEIPFLVGLPSDIHFVLGLHEGAVVGMATGFALARDEPAFVNLHTAPGLGNAINAIANARDCRAPLVVVVGQQDRRQLAQEPFLTGRSLERLAGEYPVWTNLPTRAQDVPGAIARAYNEARAARGPALVVVPMSDWDEPVDVLGAGWPDRTAHASSVSPADMRPLADLIDRAQSPALVVGAGTDSCEGWEAMRVLADRLRCPVFQESFTRRAGFPQDHPLFAGHLPWRRELMREALSPHDLVVAVGASAFRLYLLDDPGPMVADGTRVAVLTDDPSEAYRSPSELAIVAPVAAACAALAERVQQRNSEAPRRFERPPVPPPPAPGEPLSAEHVLSELADRLPRDAVVVEETPSSQPELYRRLAIRHPGGFIACANGGLGFGVAGAVGLRMGHCRRPVVGVVGDGSAMYAVQALWSAAHYEVGVLLIVMANGRYAVMDGLARARGASGPWPAFGSIDIAGIARCLGCPAVNIATHGELVEAFDAVLPGLVDRKEPLLIEVALG